MLTVPAVFPLPTKRQTTPVTPRPAPMRPDRVNDWLSSALESRAMIGTSVATMRHARLEGMNRAAVLTNP